MIRHLVLVHVSANTSPAEIASIFAQLRGLEAVVPGMRGFAAGANVSPEGFARGYSHAFSVDFESAAARDAYLIHPDHQAAGARLVGALEGGLEGLLVLDFVLS